MEDAKHLTRPKVYIEAIIDSQRLGAVTISEITAAIERHLLNSVATLQVGETTFDPEKIHCTEALVQVQVADYIGPEDHGSFHALEDVEVVILPYTLYSINTMFKERHNKGIDEPPLAHTRILQLPNVDLKEEWDSLIFDGALPAKILLCILGLLRITDHSVISLSTFNLNRLCLLYGPSGSGKSTLCRALAQKISIRLGSRWEKYLLIEISANALLSKYFGESAKAVHATFENIIELANERIFVVVMIDEVETIAGSREKSMRGSECNDGFRATNQLLIALDRLRNIPNILVLCTSNLIDAVDPAFLDRVDVLQRIPRPSTAAIYNIFRSCVNEIVHCASGNATDRNLKSLPTLPPAVSASANGETTNMLPSYAEANIKCLMQTQSPASRVLALAHKCQGLSGRTLRRLPILGLSKIWYETYSLNDVVAALEGAVDEVLCEREQDSLPAWINE